MRQENQAAYILHSRPYSDSSLIVDLFSAEHGRISAVAKGARRLKRGKQHRQPLQVLTPLTVSWQGRSGLKTLLNYESQQQAHKLQGPLFYSAMYVNELLLKLLAEADPAPAIFSHYVQLLLALEHGRPLEQELRKFELSLLSELGYQLNCNVESGGRAISAQVYYAWHEQRGFYQIDPALLQQQVRGPACFSGQLLLEIAEQSWSPASLKTAKVLLRQVLASLLGGKPLKSRDIYRQMIK